MNLRLPTTLTILPTYRCTAACSHCCFGSHPFVKGRIPQERILSYIDQAAKLGIFLIVFSGGEPFLLDEDLDQAIAYATQLGLMTRVVSNAFWAVNETNTHKRLERLREAGLDELNISTGDFHQEYVPVENVVNATVAAIRQGIRTSIMVESRWGRQFAAEHFWRNERIASIIEDPDIKDLLHIFESPWIPMEMTNADIRYESMQYINKNNLHAQPGCDSILGTLVVTPQEELGVCCGLTRQQISELNVGSLREQSLRALFKKAVQDFLKIWLFVEGPAHIVAWAAEKDPTIQWENRFAHICDICRFMYHDSKVKKTIRDRYEEKILDVSMRFVMLNELEVPILMEGGFETKS